MAGRSGTAAGAIRSRLAPLIRRVSLTPATKAALRRAARQAAGWGLVLGLLLWQVHRWPLLRDQLDAWLHHGLPAGLRAREWVGQPLEERVSPERLAELMREPELFPAAYELRLWQMTAAGALSPGADPLAPLAERADADAAWIQAAINGQRLLDLGPLRRPPILGVPRGVVLPHDVDAFFEAVARRIEELLSDDLFAMYLTLPPRFARSEGEGLVALTELSAPLATSLCLAELRASFAQLGRRLHLDPWSLRAAQVRASMPPRMSFEDLSACLAWHVGTRLKSGARQSAARLVWPQWRAACLLATQAQEQALGELGLAMIGDLMQAVTGKRADPAPELAIDPEKQVASARWPATHAQEKLWHDGLLALLDLVAGDAGPDRRTSALRLAGDLNDARPIIMERSARACGPAASRSRKLGPRLGWSIPLYYEEAILLAGMALASGALRPALLRRRRPPEGLPGAGFAKAAGGMLALAWVVIGVRWGFASGQTPIGQACGLLAGPLVTGLVLRWAHGREMPGWGAGRWALWALPGVARGTCWGVFFIVEVMVRQYAHALECLHW